MERKIDIAFYYQSLVFLWMMTYVPLSCIVVFTLFELHHSRGIKRPGINIKEL